MSDCFGSTRGDRVEWSIPLPNEADQIDRLLAIMKSEAAKYGVDTCYGDWFHVEVRDHEFYDREVEMFEEATPRKHQLTFWFEKPQP